MNSLNSRQNQAQVPWTFNHPSSERHTTAAPESPGTLPHQTYPRPFHPDPYPSCGMSPVSPTIQGPSIQGTTMGFPNHSRPRPMAEFARSVCGDAGLLPMTGIPITLSPCHRLPHTQPPRRPGRRGSLQCHRCRQHKRGSRGYCETPSDDPDGPCIPCRVAKVEATCGKRTYPSGKNKAAKNSRIRMLSQLTKDESGALVRRVTPVVSHNEDSKRFTEVAEMNHRERPGHGLDVRPLLSSPTVKIYAQGTSLSSLGAQNQAVYLDSVQLSPPPILSPIPEPRHPPTPVAYDSDVADDVEMLIQSQFDSPEVQYRSNSVTGNIEIRINQNDAPAGMEELNVPRNMHVGLVEVNDSTEVTESESEGEPVFDFWGSGVMDTAFYGTFYDLPASIAPFQNNAFGEFVEGGSIFDEKFSLQ